MVIPGIAFMVAISSCERRVNPHGEIELERGDGEKKMVKYSLTLDDSLLRKYTEGRFQGMIVRTSWFAKNSCKYEGSFNPLKAYVYSHDTTFQVSFYYICKNGFGAEDERNLDVYFTKKGRAIDYE